MMRVAITHAASRGPYLADAPPLDEPLASPRARKMMSRSAYLATLALADLMRSLDISAQTRACIGYFLGVGGSAGSLDDVTALLDASIVDDRFSLPAFGDRGLAACNPLLAFQLMNNFTMCHGAILENLGGPNAALFSRGAGTIAAIEEARHAVASGDCPLAIAGGADVGTHPVTLAELARDGHIAAGMVPADAAALVALAPSTKDDDVVIEGCAHASGRDRSIAAALDDALSRVRHVRHAWHATLQSPATSAPASAFANRNPGTVMATGVASVRPADIAAPADTDAPTGIDAPADIDAAAGIDARADTDAATHTDAPADTAAATHTDAPADTAAAADIDAPADLDAADVVVIAAWGPPAVDCLRSFATRFPTARVIDVCANGDAIAASPAFALIAAIEELRATPGRALVLTLGIDGDPGAILLSRGVA